MQILEITNALVENFKKNPFIILLLTIMCCLIFFLWLQVFNHIPTEIRTVNQKIDKVEEKIDKIEEKIDKLEVEIKESLAEIKGYLKGKNEKSTKKQTKK